MLKIMSYAALVAAASGCAAPVNQAFPNASYDADKWACMQQLARMDAAANAAGNPAGYTTDCTTNGQNTNCSTVAISPSSGQGGLVGLFKDSPMTVCMKAKGWK